jgi:alpha-tubulin suppressor-like RCC1 family protein
MRIVLAALASLLVVGCSSAASSPDAGDTSDSGTAPDVAAPDAGNVTGISKVATGEYVTAYLSSGRLYEVAGGTDRLGAGPNPGPMFPPNEVAFAKERTIVDVAGGLHVTIAADDLGQVWEWGDAASNPALIKSNVPVQITTDSQGNPFTLLDGQGHNVRGMQASGATSIAIKGDGTVWVWDDCSGGLQGDGTAGSATVTQPIRVNIPLAQGVTITKVAISDVAIALASDGTVWTWGGNGVKENLGTGSTDFMTPHPITTPMGKVVDLATGNSFSYALTEDGKLFGWGAYAHIAGACPGSGWCPAMTPIDLTGVVIHDGNTAHITSIASNLSASYAVLSDGSIWAWGSNGQGLVGTGPEMDMKAMNYTWDWGKDEMMIYSAVRILATHNDVTKVFTNASLAFYTYVQTADGRLFSWGRNKTGNLGNGISPLNSQQAGAYPNSWDVTTPTEVDPMHEPNKPTSSPQCIDNPDAGSCWCAGGPNGPQNC